MRTTRNHGNYQNVPKVEVRFEQLTKLIIAFANMMNRNGCAIISIDANRQLNVMDRQKITCYDLYTPRATAFAAIGVSSNVGPARGASMPKGDAKMSEKYCPKCDTVKTLQKFPKDKNRPDGRGGYCKVCRRAYYRANRERLIEAAIEWQEENPERAARNTERWNRRHPNRQRARTAVRNAVNCGELPPISTQECEACGGQANHYHHHKGYERKHWLDVQPLCTRCHGESHWIDKHA